MSALTAEKGLVLRARYWGGAKLPIADGEIIYAGAAIVAVAGEWANVTATNGLEARIAEAAETVDNTDDGKAIEGIFYDQHGRWLTPYRNDTGAPITAADLGTACFFLDNQTVTMTDGGGEEKLIPWQFGHADSFGSPDTTIVWVEVR